MRLLGSILDLLEQHRTFRRVQQELAGYSDRELADLGIGRGDIVRLAWDESERAVAARPAPAKKARAEQPRPAFTFADAR